jgi:hypothetical protein
MVVSTRDQSPHMFLNKHKESGLHVRTESEWLCHTRFLCQTQVLIVCMTQDQLFHTYGPKVFINNQISRIKYNYYISNVSKDYDDYQWNGTVEDSITP